MAQMEIHTITALGGCAVTLMQEQTSHSDPGMPLTQHGNARHSLLSSRVHNNHSLCRTAGVVANEDACIWLTTIRFTAKKLKTAPTNREHRIHPAFLSLNASM